MTDKTEAMKAKIAALLAKAERTDNDAERDAYSQKAESLMIKLGIERADLEFKGEVKPEEITKDDMEWAGNYGPTMVSFAYGVVRAMGNLDMYQRKNYNGMLHWTTIVGTKSDIEQAKTLLTSLHLQAMTGLKRFQKENRESRRYMTDMEKFIQNRSFLSGFGSEVARRVRETRTVEEKDATPGAALVLASKEDRVKAHMASLGLGKARGGTRSHDYLASAAGRVAGQSANIGGTGVGRGRGGAVTA